MGTPTIFDRPLTGYKTVNTQFGDTLQAIALRETGDARNWHLLIAINALIYPYITDDPTQVVPGVIQSGKQILVPASVPEISTQVDPADIFFVDVGLDATGHLQIEAGDFGTVSGVDNLVQAWTNRLETDKGELVFHQNYGSLLRQLIGAINGPNAGLLAEQYAATDILNDPRAKQVLTASAQIQDDQTIVQLSVQPNTSSVAPVPISVSI